MKSQWLMVKITFIAVEIIFLNSQRKIIFGIWRPYKTILYVYFRLRKAVFVSNQIIFNTFIGLIYCDTQFPNDLKGRGNFFVQLFASFVSTIIFHISFLILSCYGNCVSYSRWFIYLSECKQLGLKTVFSISQKHFCI